MLTNIGYRQRFCCGESITPVTMCDVLNIKRSTYYYHMGLSGVRARKAEDMAFSKEIERIFKISHNNYGTRKIKKELTKLQ